MKKHFAARSSEWLNAFLLSAWGGYTLLHPGLFSGVMNVSFHGLLSIMPQEYWGFLAFFCGNVRVAALFINGQWSITPLIRVLTSFMSVFVWFWICVGLYLAGTPQTGIVIYLGLMLSDIFSAARAASDAYEAEANKRVQKLSEASSNVTSLRSR